MLSTLYLVRYYPIELLVAGMYIHVYVHIYIDRASIPIYQRSRLLCLCNQLLPSTAV